MFYYSVDLNGVPTKAKTELTTHFQWVHQYYYGRNIDGTGRDDHADHHIWMRLDNINRLFDVLYGIKQQYSVIPTFYQVLSDHLTCGSKRPIIELFERDYTDETVKPVPYTFAPNPCDDDAPEPHISA